MKVLIISVGTRGDMEPFLAIGEILKKVGNEVICAFPEQFKPLVESTGFRFESLGTKFIELLESDDGKAAMGGAGSGLKKFMSTVRLAFKQGEANKELVHRQDEIIKRQNPDQIIYNGKAVVPLLWSVQHPGQTVFLSPIPDMHPRKDVSHVAFNSNLGPMINGWTYALAEFGLVTTAMISAKWLGSRKMYRRKDVRKAIRENRSFYSISTSLYNAAPEWPKHIAVLGFPERKQDKSWAADPALEQFIEEHKKILFISFGSMTNPNPENISRMFISVLEKLEIPAIINVASGGLMKPDHNCAHIFFTDQIPYERIFPRVYGVIHHGGSGTTHLGLKHGKPTLIIPHIIDQFVWNRIVSKKQAGPKGTAIRKLNVLKLEKLIRDLYENEQYIKNATLLAEQMHQEKAEEKILEFLLPQK
jgi:sterol 3beta-glucosyltransferase